MRPLSLYDRKSKRRFGARIRSFVPKSPSLAFSIDSTGKESSWLQVFEVVTEAEIARGKVPSRILSGVVLAGSQYVVCLTSTGYVVLKWESPKDGAN